ncbi:organomercurial lyase MerB [Nocardioides panzhihuensis]|uniref:Alkylmercury lyase n=1 Tax=Nocardioides panzhihuensis TaxID=860243 RepID=A0A7Z0IVQ2_9ACTN|nr:organomercurial lyase MerB [Nocardioides panzhihuensis]NYI81245.1 alkylmercury lyase [Nocardioides panzhihuensis]
MSNLSIDLTDRLANTEETGLDAGLLIPLLRLLVDGNPVTVEQLATASGRTVGDVRSGLGAVPDTEYDDQGHIVGQGLTLRPTRHRFTVAGEELYTWCALDTLIFPALIGRPARVESVSPVSGETIRVTIDPTAGTTVVEPATAVVSLVNPRQITSIRSMFCNQVHYFTSPEDAADWLAGHPGAEIVSVAEAYQIGIALNASFHDRAQAESVNNTGSPACDC